MLYNVTHIYDSNNSGPNGIEMQPLLLDTHVTTISGKNKQASSVIFASLTADWLPLPHDDTQEFEPHPLRTKLSRVRSEPAWQPLRSIIWYHIIWYHIISYHIAQL